MRKGARTIDVDDWWTTSLSLGPRFDFAVRGSRLAVVPGYAFDYSLPSRVRASSSDFDAQALFKFEAEGQDIHGDAAKLVLAGRARPAAVGTQQTFRHQLMLSLRLGSPRR